MNNVFFFNWLTLPIWFNYQRFCKRKKNELGQTAWNIVQLESTMVHINDDEMPKIP